MSSATDTFVGIAGVAVAVLIPLIAFLYNRRKKLGTYYKIIWKKTSKLNPNDILEIRGRPEKGFNQYYYERPIDAEIRNKLESGKNVLVIGSPLAGKTRSVYQALVTSAKPRVVIVPRVVSIDPERFQVPTHLGIQKGAIILFDDLNKFIMESTSFLYVLRLFMGRNVTIAATCRSGPEYDALRSKVRAELFAIFDQPIEIGRISEEEAEKIAQKAGRVLPESFDGNIGSIFLPLDVMRERFQDCNEAEKAVLKSLRRLYYAGIYEEKQVFAADALEEICKKREGFERKHYEWVGLLKGLENKGFIELLGSKIQIEETYLESVIEDEFSKLDNLDEMMEIFREKPTALLAIGKQAYALGWTGLEKAAYEKKAIESIRQALRVYTFEKFPMQYGLAQIRLGAAYVMLADVQDRAKNCRLTIESCKQALRVCTFEKYPLQYGVAQSNLGAAYVTLAEVEDKAKNCGLAIESCKQALRVYTFEKFPMQYGVAQSNLGATYVRLAEVADKAKNCGLAIESCKQALRVYTFEKYPLQYGAAQINLGYAYVTLAGEEDKAKNCGLAIESIRQALRVYTFEKFPMQYGVAQSNLGDAYKTLAEVEDKAKNCGLAIESCKQALRVYTFEKFPMQYGMAQSNLGDAYKTLAEVEDKAKNCGLAIESYREALRVYTETSYPDDSKSIKRNLEHTLSFSKKIAS